MRRSSSSAGRAKRTGLPVHSGYSGKVLTGTGPSLRNNLPQAEISIIPLEPGLEQGEERKIWKLRLIRLLYERGYERKDVLELFRFIDWLLMLPPELERSFTEELSRIEEERGMEYVTSVERVGIEKGIKKGIKRGVKKGRKKGLEESRKMLTETLSIRFGSVSDEAIRRIGQISDYEELRRLLRLAVRCGSPQEFTDGLP